MPTVYLENQACIQNRLLRVQCNLSKTTAQGTFKTWSLLPGGLLIQGHLTGNSIPWSWLQWSSETGGRLIRVVALTGFTVCVHVHVYETG